MTSLVRIPQGFHLSYDHSLKTAKAGLAPCMHLMDRRIGRVAFTGFVVAMFVFSAVLASAPSINLYSSPINLVTHTFSMLSGPSASATSTNWSGYVVTGPTGSVTDVKGSWKVPSIQGTCPKASTYSLAWVGIDGYTSSTVEQVGTASNCASGKPQYYAWYETYPKPLQTIAGFQVSPGDVISAEVSYASGTFTVHITDLTHSQDYTHKASVSGASRSSAEWIIEAPTSTGTTVLPLANFGTTNLGSDYTTVASTCYATVSGLSGGIGSFGSATQVTMTGSGGTVKAQSSTLTTDGQSFSITWKSQ
jgi:hypothetical protein